MDRALTSGGGFHFDHHLTCTAHPNCGSPRSVFLPSSMHLEFGITSHIAPDGSAQHIRSLSPPNIYLRLSRLLLRGPVAIPQLHLDCLNSSLKPSFPANVPLRCNLLVSSNTQSEYRPVVRILMTSTVSGTVGGGNLRVLSAPNKKAKRPCDGCRRRKGARRP